MKEQEEHIIMYELSDKLNLIGFTDADMIITHLFDDKPMVEFEFDTIHYTIKGTNMNIHRIRNVDLKDVIKIKEFTVDIFKKYKLI